VVLSEATAALVRGALAPVSRQPSLDEVQLRV
jgi:hypothetical protein